MGDMEYADLIVVDSCSQTQLNNNSRRGKFTVVHLAMSNMKTSEFHSNFGQVKCIECLQHDLTFQIYVLKDLVLRVWILD